MNTALFLFDFCFAYGFMHHSPGVSTTMNVMTGIAGSSLPGIVLIAVNPVVPSPHIRLYLVVPRTLK